MVLSEKKLKWATHAVWLRFLAFVLFLSFFCAPLKGISTTQRSGPHLAASRLEEWKACANHFTIWANWNLQFSLLWASSILLLARRRPLCGPFISFHSFIHLFVSAQCKKSAALRQPSVSAFFQTFNDDCPWRKKYLRNKDQSWGQPQQQSKPVIICHCPNWHCKMFFTLKFRSVFSVCAMRKCKGKLARKREEEED